MLDSLISPKCRSSYLKVPESIKMILRLGLYQIISMDRVPASAAVSESVELAKRYGHKGTAGMVNAILRRFSEEREELIKRLNSWNEQDIQQIATHTSHPEWLVKRYVEEFGLEKAVSILKANNEPPPQSFRVRDWAKLEAEVSSGRLSIEKSLYNKDGVVVGGSFQKNIEKFKYDGDIVPQDQSSLIAASLATGATGVVLELCCGRGNKSEAILKNIDNNAFIVNADLSISKLRQIREMKSNRLNPICLDAVKPFPFIDIFQFIFLDAPCSNLGTIRRHPEIRYRKSEGKITEMADIQLQLLTNAAGYLAKGGRMLYAVCSVEREETVEVVEKFLSVHPGYRSLDIGSTRPDLVEGGLTDCGNLRILPGNYGMDGFFASLIQKKE